jgi:predicted alpha-1,2-mannosidase
MNKIIPSILAGILLVVPVGPAGQADEQELVRYVNPLVGTRDMGHCYPGATVPFGMVQLSPDTDTVPYSTGAGYNPAVYRYCAGYQYDDPTIVGFSHTHFNGTGHSDLGDFLIMPTIGPLQWEPGTADHPEQGYRSRFSHARESASPGFYAVRLDDYGIQAELTASTRVGMHRYTFPASEEAHIILDLVHGIYNYDGKVIWAFIRVENATLVTGFRQTNGWARTRYVYFALAFSKPIESFNLVDEKQQVYKGFWRKWDQNHDFPEMAGQKVKAAFHFSTREGEHIMLKMALSSVSTEGAVRNLAEIPDWNFDRVRSQAAGDWQQELGKIRINGSENQKRVFYTSLYHTFLSPITYMDVDGQYRGLDQNIHQASGFTNYTIFSLWDTYRALHPLLTLIQSARTGDMIRSMLAHYDQSVHHLLPVWSHYANENWCMIGYHAVPVIADAYLKGIRGFDAEKAFEACVSSATYGPYDGLSAYMELGYVPASSNTSSASKTLEYAYDDFSLAAFARALGKTEPAALFTRRARSFERVFDLQTGFARARNADGSWATPFDPLDTHDPSFIEGNAWNYSFYVPHDVARLIELMGGSQRFTERLDALFTMELPEKYYARTEDIEKVGLIGNYVHGNEPSHHVPYLYCYAGSPWKTQEKIHLITRTMYRDAPDGLCGNDDCGQMSAWYIFSALGFYPVCPGTNEYVIGSPCIPEAAISLGEGKQLTMKALGLSQQNIYIQSVELNGKPWNKTYLRHEDLVQGGEIIFRMGPKPNKKWGTGPESRPSSLREQPGTRSSQSGRDN